MTKKEKIRKEISLAFAFAREILNDPSLLNQIPDGATIDFLEEGEPVVEKSDSKGKKYIRVKKRFEVL